MANWHPGRQALICTYCGTVSPATLATDGSLVKEHDLVAALRRLPDDRKGWEGERVSVKCQSCQAISLFDPTRVAQNCEFCGSPKIIPQTAARAPIVPESVLPFKVAESDIRESVRRWYGGRWFAPNRLKSAALTDTVHGIYIPYWTFDARVTARWTAEAGYYYYETVRRGGKTQRVRKVRWEHASGSLKHFFDDHLIPATKGVHENLLRQVEPFPTYTVEPYDQGYVSGWVVEQYQIDLVAAADRARNPWTTVSARSARRRCLAIRSAICDVEADYTSQTFKHILVPVWLVAYNYGAKAFQVVVNGSTGRLAGEYPLSWVKIFLVALAAFLVFLIFVYLDQS